MNFYALFNCIIRVKMFRIINISYISDEKMQKISCKKREKSVKKTHNYTKCIFEIVKIKINIVNIQKCIAIRKAMW